MTRVRKAFSDSAALAVTMPPAFRLAFRLAFTPAITPAFTPAFTLAFTLAITLAIALGLAGAAPSSHAAADAAAAAAASIAAINAVRAGAVCAAPAAPARAGESDTAAPAATAAALAPLAIHPQLDAAAAALSRNPGGPGRPLNEVLRSAGYRATHSMFLQVSGVASAAALARFVEQRYCSQITSADWQEIGLHQRFSGTQPQTWLVLASPFTPPSAEQAGAIGARVLALVNLARREARNCGDKPFAATTALKWNDTLERTGLLHAADMAGHSYFSHDGRDGSKPAARATRAGYVWRAVGENIAAGQTTAEAAVQGWIDSPPHCANLMSPQFTEMGVAYSVNLQSAMGIYWAQLFGAPRAGAP